MSSVNPPVPPEVPPGPATPSDGSRGVLAWIATSNPFYVISAGLFLLGLRVSFGAQVRDIDTWALMTGLAGYTLLLAAAALLLVRFAGVWNDVRTVLLLVVLMFLATSVTFDELLALSPDRGRRFYLGGLLFAVLVSEGLIRGIKLRLPAGFRAPYYLTLGLFFLYPLALVPVVRDPHGEALMWGLFGFSPAAGLVFLTLIPAVRRGPGYLRDNGSPWPWPFYPWSLFVFLAVAVVGRSFLLCWSFHLLDAGSMDQTIFGPYFLVPFGFALAVLVLELGLVARRRAVMWVALAVPAGLVGLAGTGHDEGGIYQEFLGIFAARMGGSPLFLTLLAAAAYYFYACVRRAPFATEGLTAALAGLAFAGPDTFSLSDLLLTQPGLLAGVVVFQGVVGVWRRDAWRVIAVAGVAGGWLTGAIWRLYVALKAEVAGLDYLILSLCLFPVAVLISLGKAGILARWLTVLRRNLARSTQAR
ncbi:MAG: hypothetical protein JWO38_5098 [Gemmataceae bacterium]|nr:hypothetical protein [Gemmataceae bacterium]